MQKKARDFLKKIDIFGIPIGLTYKKDFSFKTSFGGMMSIIVIAAILFYFGFNLYSLIKGDATFKYY